MAELFAKNCEKSPIDNEWDFSSNTPKNHCFSKHDGEAVVSPKDFIQTSKRSCMSPLFRTGKRKPEGLTLSSQRALKSALRRPKISDQSEDSNEIWKYRVREQAVSTRKNPRTTCDNGKTVHRTWIIFSEKRNWVSCASFKRKSEALTHSVIKLEPAVWSKVRYLLSSTSIVSSHVVLMRDKLFVNRDNSVISHTIFIKITSSRSQDSPDAHDALGFNLAQKFAKIQGLVRHCQKSSISDRILSESLCLAAPAVVTMTTEPWSSLGLLLLLFDLCGLWVCECVCSYDITGT